MANFQNGINITGSTSYINLSATTENTSSVGKLWWDDSTQNFKYSGCITIFTTGGSLINGRRCHTAAGTSTAALAAGGSPQCQCTEEYDGTSWSAGGSLISPHFGGVGQGTQNAAWTACRITMEEYNGASWSSGGFLTYNHTAGVGIGTQNAALAAGGYSDFQASDYTEEYNGTSWATVDYLITCRGYLGASGAGTQNAALAAGGYYFSILTCTEEYNGTSWSTGGDLITGRSKAMFLGTQNSALAASGAPTLTSTEAYDGTSWSVSGNLPNSSTDGAASGACGESGLLIGGQPATTTTLELSEGIGIIEF